MIESDLTTVPYEQAKCQQHWANSPLTSPMTLGSNDILLFLWIPEVPEAEEVLLVRRLPQRHHDRGPRRAGAVRGQHWQLWQQVGLHLQAAGFHHSVQLRCV